MVLTVLKTIEILQLQFIDKVIDVSVVQVQQVPRVQSVRRQSRSHSCSSLQRGHLSFTCSSSCNDRCRVVQTSENCEGPAVAVHLNVVDVPVVHVCWRSSSRSSPYGGYGGVRVFAVKYGIFRAPPGRLELSASFSEPLMVKSSLPSRAPLHN